MPVHGDSWYTDSSFSSLLVKLSQVLELALLDSIIKLKNIYRVNCHNENMTKPFDYLVHKQWCQDFSSWWHWHFHWHEYLLLRNELSILSKWHAFAGYQLGFAVCTNCFEKCINCCANVNSDVRNAPKRLRKTVIFWVYIKLFLNFEEYWIGFCACSYLVKN